MSNVQTKKDDCAGDFWQGNIFGCSFRNWRMPGLLHGHMRMTGRIYGRLKKKLYEVVQLDDITVNWKLAGIRSIKIITSSIYVPSEVV